MTVYESPGSAIVISVIRQLIGFALTLVAWRIYRRWPVSAFHLSRHWWLVGLCCAVLLVADMTLAEVARSALDLGPQPDVVFRGSVFIRASLYVGWSTFYFAIRHELTTRRKEVQVAQLVAAHREAELQLLRAQVNPHFLFNALNSIIGEAESNPAAVVATTHAMADYLRYSLSNGAHTAPFGHELDAMASYLHVEQAHLGATRLDWNIDASEAARTAIAPTALVQPLIENAIKYGLRTSPSLLTIRVSASVRAERLYVVVENSGQWIARAAGETARDSTGIGLKNLQRRLALLCGDLAVFSVRPSARGIRVEIELPYSPPTLASAFRREPSSPRT